MSSALESAVASWGVSRLWLGLILVPIVGNAAEHSTAVMVARKGNAELSIDIAAGSSAQIALVVTYIRSAWGNTGGPVTPAQVKALEKK